MEHTYRLWFFAPMEGEAVAAYLCKMARRGWRLEEAGRYFWRFVRAEPAPLTYAVTYFPDASRYGGATTEEQDELLDYCAAAGWTYVTQWHRMQVFVTDRSDPIPLETDEEQKLRTIEATIGRDRRWAPAVWIFLLALCALLGWAAYRSPLSFWTSAPVLAVLILFPLSLLLSLLDALLNLLWLRRSRQSVAQGGPCVPMRRGIRRVLSAVLLLPTVFLLLQALWYGGFWDTLDTIWSWLCLLLLGIVVWQMRKRDYTEKSISRGIILAAVLLTAAAYLLSLLISPLTTYLRNKDRITVQVGDRSYTVFADPVPMDFADLGVENEKFPADAIIERYDRSPLASAMSCRVLISLVDPKMPYLYYTIVHTASPAITDLCLQDPDLMREGMVKVSDDGWQAEAVYADFSNNIHLICWDQALLYIVFRDGRTDPTVFTQQQKETIRQLMMETAP